MAYADLIQDFRSAYYGWNAVYGTMTCKLRPPSHIDIIC